MMPVSPNASKAELQAETIAQLLPYFVDRVLAWLELHDIENAPRIPAIAATKQENRIVA